MAPIIRRISLILVFPIVSMWMIIFFMPLPPLLNGMSFSRAVYDENHQLLRLTLSEDAKYRLYTPLSSIPQSYVSATLLQEDQYFHWHWGANPVSLVKAVWHTYFSKTRRIGASTITMQVARIRYGIHSKALTGKFEQIFRALQLELHYSKKQILEAYFNLAPYGHNIEGVGAASLIYFDKPIHKLILPESLTLAVIPQNPVKRIPRGGELKNIRDKLYVRWIQHHPEDKDKQSLFALPLQMRSLKNIPFRAPHFVNEVLSDTNIKTYEVNTTLDFHLQTMIERITKQYISRKININVNNAAVLLIDTRNMGVKTMIGSENFFNEKISGQINGTTIRRSPGSTLKPLIYALALDQGLIHPGTILKDVPHSFGSYNPENFDNDFMGPIHAKDALVLSRNIPAIYLAEKLKNPSLYDFLQSAMIQDLKSEEYYGLALVLGGAELSMTELAGLYATLANDGLWQPLKFNLDVTQKQSKRLLSPEASFLVLDMLNTGNSISLKTGTSSGYRDAWTIGTVGPYVLAVWIGNFNNESNPVFIGKQIAAPLFSEIAAALKNSVRPEEARSSVPSRRVLNIIKTDICKESGMLPTRYCPKTEKVWFIPGKSPIQSDTVFREIAINTKTGLRACKFDANTRFEVHEFWSSDLSKIFARARLPRKLPPPYDAACVMGDKDQKGFSPQIISPQTDVQYITRIGNQKDAIIPLSAVVDADVKNVYWFLDNSFLGKTTRDKSFLWNAVQGKHVIRVVDDYGRADVRDVVIMNQV